MTEHGLLPKAFVACCAFPDHSDKTPSFIVNAAKRFYHCFGCGRHGNAIGFLMEFAQLRFHQAVLELSLHKDVDEANEVSDLTAFLESGLGGSFALITVSTAH